MLTPRPEKCWWCGEWAVCRWTMDPIARRCLKCIDAYETFMDGA